MLARGGAEAAAGGKVDRRGGAAARGEGRAVRWNDPDQPLRFCVRHDSPRLADRLLR